MYTYCSRIEENTKKQAVELLEGLGLNLSDAVNMFLRQVILQNGIPFEVKYPEDTLEFRPEVIEAMEEALRGVWQGILYINS